MAAGTFRARYTFRKETKEEYSVLNPTVVRQGRDVIKCAFHSACYKKWGHWLQERGQ